MNLNIELFRRTSPRKKLEIIDNATESELHSISKSTITRMVKASGVKRGNTHDKDFYIRHDVRQGNLWNSTIESLSLYKGRLYVNAYIQLCSTDIVDTVPYVAFFARGDFRGSIKHSDNHGNTTHSYYHYTYHNKADVIRSICQEYVLRKYQEKLQG